MKGFVATEMQEVTQRNKRRVFKIWVSYVSKCLSFHRESAFEMEAFESSRLMWQRIYELIEQGYVVQ